MATSSNFHVEKTMQGASAQSAGIKGLVPAPAAGDQDKYLKGDGSWEEVQGGAKTITVTGSITNTSGSFSGTISDNRVTADMKPVGLEVGTPATFQDQISVTCNAGSITIACANMAGSSTIKVTILKAIDDPTAVTSTEYDILDNAKANKVSNATNGNFAGLDSNGNLTDSGHKHSDYLTAHQDITGKADKVLNATSGNFAGLDANGNLTDSGHKHSDYLTSHQDITGKADKVTGATSGNFAGLDANGNLTDSGNKANDFITKNQGDTNRDKILKVFPNGYFGLVDNDRLVSVSTLTFQNFDTSTATCICSESNTTTHAYVHSYVAAFEIDDPSKFASDITVTHNGEEIIFSASVKGSQTVNVKAFICKHALDYDYTQTLATGYNVLSSIATNSQAIANKAEVVIMASGQGTTIESGLESLVSQMSDGQTSLGRIIYGGNYFNVNITRRNASYACAVVVGYTDDFQIYNAYKNNGNWNIKSIISRTRGAIDIAANTNLNNLTSPGDYMCRTGSIAQSLTNCPITINFVMHVFEKGEYIVQEILIGDKMYSRNQTSSGFGHWYQYSGTDLGS